MWSLRRRAFWSVAVWGALSVTVAFFFMVAFFDTLAQVRFDRGLLIQHRLAVMAITLGDGQSDLDRFLDDAGYSTNASSRYWQVIRPDGTILASASLAGTRLPVLPTARDAPARVAQTQTALGPVRLAQQSLTLDGGQWIISVADSLASLDYERRQTFRSLLVALGLVGLLGLLGASLQVSAALRPLGRLRDDVITRWEAGETLHPETYPEEVAPLVADINILLDRNRAVIESARRQAADLAHTLKTPLAILRNELDREGRRSKADKAVVRDALDRVDAQILRSLARIRAGNAAAVGYRTELAASVERLARLFRRAPDSEGRMIEIAIPDLIVVAMDRQDLEEALGNLMENALKWCRSKVRVSARAEDGTVMLSVDDDGPGIPEERREAVLRAGERLDTSSPGSGLGLAIVHDLVTAYGGRIDLTEAPALGGLRVTLFLPERIGFGEFRRNGHKTGD